LIILFAYSGNLINNGDGAALDPAEFAQALRGKRLTPINPADS
jgi:hypothetical protein